MSWAGVCTPYLTAEKLADLKAANDKAQKEGRQTELQQLLSAIAAKKNETRILETGKSVC